MPFKVYRDAAKKLRLLTQSEFFRDVSLAAGGIDEDTTKRVYNGMLQVLYRELREKGALRFPALCDFRMVLGRPRFIKNHMMAEGVYKGEHNQMRINPIYTIRKYFKEFDRLHPGVILDPSERMKREGITYAKRIVVKKPTPLL